MKYALIIAFVFLCQGAQAQRFCEGLFRSAEYRGGQESAIEIEIGPTDTLINKLINTTDGTIAPVLAGAGVKAIPESILKTIEEAFPDSDPLKFPWDLLTAQEKRDLIMQSAKMRAHNFNQSRTIPGLAFYETFSLTFASPTRFMGEMFVGGAHTFHRDDIFPNTKIEYMGPERMTSDLGFEIHLRGASNFEDNYESSKVLQALVLVKPNPVHGHVLGRVPIKALLKTPLNTAYKMTEFFRRVNLKAQFTRIKRGFPIEINKKGDIVNMPILEKSDISKIFDYFSNDYLNPTWVDRMSYPGGRPLSEKAGLVGIRSHHAYDGPMRVWGLELRDLSPSHDQFELRQLLRSVQIRMTNGDYGVADLVAPEWIMKLNLQNGNIKGILYPDQAEYQNPQAQLAFLTPTMDILKDPAFVEKLRPQLEKYKTNAALGLLFHIWEFDPLLTERPELVEQMLLAQDRALTEFANGESDTVVLKRFVTTSGIDKVLDDALLLPW